MSVNRNIRYVSCPNDVQRFMPAPHHEALQTEPNPVDARYKINTKARMGPLAPILPNWLVIDRRFLIRSDHPSAFVFKYLSQHSGSPVAQVHDTNGDRLRLHPVY